MQISAGLPDPSLMSTFPRLSYMLKGLQRSRAITRSPRQRLPVTPQILAMLQATWSTPPITYDSHLLWAACCVGFFGFLRAGEFIARSASDSSGALIAASDVTRDLSYPPNFVKIHLRQSKTDSFGRGVDIFLGRTNQAICPVAAILSFLTVRPAGMGGPLFCFQDGSVLSRERLVGEVRAALQRQGLDASRYSGHSFRIGAATTAAAAGVPDHTIKILGRWESAAYHLYIRTPPAQLASVSARLVGSSDGANP